MDRNIPMPDFVNVVGTGTAICTMTPEVIGKVIEGIMIKLGGTFTRANITAWRLKLDGKVVRWSTGADQNTIYTFFNRTNTATEMMIDFMNVDARTPNAYCVGALDLGGVEVSNKVNNVTLEVDISGATNPTLSAQAYLSPSMDIMTERPVRWAMLREERAQIVVGASGETNIAQFIPHFIPSLGGGTFSAIHLFAANITELRVRRNGEERYKTTVAKLQAEQKRAKRVPQSNHVCLDFMPDGMLENRLFDTRPAAGVQSADFYVTLSGAETFWVQTQQYAPLNAF